MVLHKKWLAITILITLAVHITESSIENIAEPPVNNLAVVHIENENCISRNNNDTINQLYNSVIVADYEEAVTKCLKLEKNGRGKIISAFVTKLLEDSKKNTVDFAYKLWTMFGRNIVKDYFPIQFRLLLNGDLILITSKKYNRALNLDFNTDENDRLVFGDEININNNNLNWRIFPVWENNRVYFKIKNIYRHQYLKLEIRTNLNGDNKAWSSDSDDTYRHQWYLHPVMNNNELIFYVYNREYNKPLKLSADVSTSGTRQLWGHNGNSNLNPEQFGWNFSPIY